MDTVLRVSGQGWRETRQKREKGRERERERERKCERVKDKGKERHTESVRGRVRERWREMEERDHAKNTVVSMCECMYAESLMHV